MKKLLMAGLFLGLVCMAKSVSAEVYTHRYSTTISTVSIGDAAIYEVIMSTAGTAGDYIQFYDTISVGGLATTWITSAPFVVRLLYSTATASGASVPGNTIYKFDPPLQFDRGIMLVPNSAAESATIIYKRGRP